MITNVLDAIIGELANLLEIFEVEDDASGSKGGVLVGMTHGDDEAFGAVHEYVVVHLSIARFEYVEYVLGVGRVDDAPQREEGEDFCRCRGWARC